MTENNKKIDLRVQKTQRAIKNTLKEMICEMPPNEITVKTLTDRAEIHRKTFYLHYTSMRDLFQTMFQEIADNYYQNIEALPPTMPVLAVNRVFFEMLAHAEPYEERLFIDAEYQAIYHEQFQQAFLKHNRERYNPYAQFPQEEQNVINAFLTNSSISMYRQWVNNGKKIPLERLIELSGRLLTQGVNGLSV